MNQLTLLTTVEWIVAFVLVTGLLFLSYMIATRILTWYIKEDLSIKSNSAFAIIITSIMIVVGMMINASMDPIGEAIRILSNSEMASSRMYLEIAKYVLLLLSIAFGASLISCGVGFWLFALMTRDIDERQEIIGDNWRIGLVVGTVLIMIAFVTSNQMVHFMESVLPYPDIPNLF